MIAVFEAVIPALKVWEGGYSNDPDDPGGETHWGISKQQYPEMDIKNLTFEDACVIYRRDYWNRYRLGELKNQDIANKLFLSFVNLNPVSVARAAQWEVNLFLSPTAHVTVDGVFGSLTIDAINSLVYPGYYLDALRIAIARIYLDLKNVNVKYIRGLIRRALA